MSKTRFFGIWGNIDGKKVILVVLAINTLTYDKRAIPRGGGRARRNKYNYTRHIVKKIFY